MELGKNLLLANVCVEPHLYYPVICFMFLCSSALLQYTKCIFRAEQKCAEIQPTAILVSQHICSAQINKNVVAPDVLVGALHGFHRHRCMNVCECNAQSM